ncbi:MAG: glycosyltransferase, partial [Acidobacteria bacterium]
ELTPNVVEFRGTIADTVPLYREVDIFVLTSDWEGTPNVILEAMASGLPVVATRVGGVPEIVQHGETGFLVDPEDEDGMVDAILTLIKNRDLRLKFGRAGREFVLAQHSLDKLPGYLQKLYELALA